MENCRSKRSRGVKLQLPGRPFIWILQRLRRLKHRDSYNKRFQKKQFDHSDSSSAPSSRVILRSKRYRGVKLKLPGSPFIRILQRLRRLRRLKHRDSNNKRYQKKQFDHSDSSSGGRKIIGRHHRPIDLNDTVVKRKTKKMDDDFIIDGRPHPFILPHKIAKKLHPPQIQGLKWLFSLHHKGRGGILADDMVLRVTVVQICCFIAGLFNSNLANSVLIVCQNTCSNIWLEELSDVELSATTKMDFIFSDEHPRKEFRDGKVVYLATYDFMTNFTPKDAGKNEALLDYMFLDEGHRIKNRNTETAKSLSRLSCLHRIIITAIPLQNNLMELWALFEFCVPGLLGSENEFVNKYGCIHDIVEENTNIKERRLGYSAVKKLRKSICPYFLRRTISDFGVPLPKKNEMVIWLKLTPIQRQSYKDFLKNMETSSENHLSALLTLKQLCDHPLLVNEVAKDVVPRMDSFVDEELTVNLMRDISCKIAFISSLLNDLRRKGHFILIFSQTAQMLRQIEDFLKNDRIVCSRLDGKTKPQHRQKLVKDFQEGKGPNILLLTSGVGGSQLTLTKADRVILVNPSWNPCTDNQCVDRAYGIGQTKDVIVYRLITCGTIEEKIYIKQVLKEGLFRSITEKKQQPRYFNTEDSKGMYNLPKEEAFDSSQAALHLPEQQDHQHTMHVEFLNTLGIAGVTDHSILFSNTVPVQGDVVEGEFGCPARHHHVPCRSAPSARTKSGQR